MIMIRNQTGQGKSGKIHIYNKQKPGKISPLEYTACGKFQRKQLTSKHSREARFTAANLQEARQLSQSKFGQLCTSCVHAIQNQNSKVNRNGHRKAKSTSPVKNHK